MASQLYPLGKKAILDGGIALLTDSIKVLGIDTADVTYDAADQFHADIAAAGIVFTSGALAGKTTTLGVFNANDVNVLAITGDSIEALILFKDTGVSATSALIAWFDIPTYVPTGVAGDVVWHSSGLFAI